MRWTEGDPMMCASDRERDIERYQDEQREAWESDDEWTEGEFPEPSMEDEKRALSLAAELERLAKLSAPLEEESELEMLRRGAGRQQGELFPRTMYRLEVA